MDPKFLRLIPLVVLLLFTTMLAAGLFSNPEEEFASPLVGQRITPFELPVLGDETNTISPEQWRGQAVILHIFASWCPNCATENTVMMRIAKTGKAPVYGIAWKDQPTQVSAWLHKHGNPYQKIGMDPQGKTTIPLAITGTPETFVLDKNGSVYLHYKQPITDEVADRLIIPLVDKLGSGDVE